MLEDKRVNIIILCFAFVALGGLIVVFGLTRSPKKEISATSISPTPTAIKMDIKEASVSASLSPVASISAGVSTESGKKK